MVFSVKRKTFSAADESRSNIRHPVLSRTVNHEELAEIIGTG
jgi:hypothetical protein